MADGQDYIPRFETAEIGGPLWREAVANPDRFRVVQMDEKIDLQELRPDGRRLILPTTHAQARGQELRQGRFKIGTEAAPSFRGKFDGSKIAPPPGAVVENMPDFASSIDSDWALSRTGRSQLSPQIEGGLFAKRLTETRTPMRFRHQPQTPMPNAKRDPKASLADDVQNPKLDIAPGEPVAMGKTLREAAAGARRYVFDDQALKLAVQLAGREGASDKTPDGRLCLGAALPNDVASLLANAEPPADRVWIEFPLRHFWLRLESYNTIEFMDQTDEEIETTIRELSGIPMTDQGGFLFERDGEEVSVTVITHTVAPRWGAFPIGYRFALTGRPFGPIEEGEARRTPGGVYVGLRKGSMPRSDQAGRVWGYRYGVDEKFMGPLVDRAVAQTPLRFFGLDPLSGDDHRATTRSMGGMLRVAVAMLSMLNSVAAIEDATRPPGGRLLRGAVRPYLSRAPVTITVPKRIKKVVDWARREVREACARKRLHEVRPHYRHLQQQPATPGWAEVSIDGKTYWRKRIDGHLRGDPDLGVVEHTHTVVKGPKAQAAE